MVITFDEFCAAEFITGSDKEAFRAWLGNTAKAKMTHAKWWKWFSEWVRCK